MQRITTTYGQDWIARMGAGSMYASMEGKIKYNSSARPNET